MPDSGKQYIPNSILLHQAINPISALMAAIDFFPHPCPTYTKAQVNAFTINLIPTAVNIYFDWDQMSLTKCEVINLYLSSDQSPTKCSLIFDIEAPPVLVNCITPPITECLVDAKIYLVDYISPWQHQGDQST
jgi:hypothetical protein